MNDVDFLPERIKLKRLRCKRLFKQGYLLAICVIALVALGYVRDGRLQKAHAEIIILGERTSSVKQQMIMRNELEQQKAKLLITQRIENHLGSHVNVLDLLSELEQLLSPTMALTKLNVETIEVAVPVNSVGMKNISSGLVAASSSSINDVKIVKRIRLTLTGMALTDVGVANFIGQLSACPLFEEVNMGYTKTVEVRKRTAREFQASCYVVR